MTERATYLADTTLVYLLGLAARERQRRSDSLQRMRRKPGQDAVDYQVARRRKERSIEAAKEIEDTLILAVAERSPAFLRGHHRQRLTELTRAA